ncbi:hypothetical protein KCP73_01285 [Salmonella enterica subsp. enterica]|nr:hypothetical protein KCP73_01285 [Salmonella enterica subsp. enterica]
MSPIVGNGNVHAQVTAQLIYNKEQTERALQPERRCVEGHPAFTPLNISEQARAGLWRCPRAVEPTRRQFNEALIATPPTNQQTRRIRHKPAPVTTVTTLAWQYAVA